ncbi:MAG: ABC transporter permease [Clostridiales bacterium]|nr:ABC transporter permease [Clostridiales bacterium]
MKWSNFTYLVKQGFGSIWKNKLMSFASFCIILVSMLLTGISSLAMMNLNIIISNIEELNDVVVFMDKGVAEEQINTLHEKLKQTPNVREVKYRSSDEALEEFKQRYDKDYSVIFDKLFENPMPESFIIKLDDISLISNTVDNISTFNDVETVNAPYEFARFLVNMRATLMIIFGFVLFALIVVSLIIISNAVRTSVFIRRKEINIMKYVGATNTFIRTPFFVEGMIIGLIAGVICWLLTKLSYNSVMDLFNSNTALFTAFGIHDNIQFNEISLVVLLLYCGFGAALSAFGTMISMGKHLKV